MTIIVERTNKTQDGIFGKLTLDCHPFTCVTMENLSKAIPSGVYGVKFDYSPHFNRVMPHILVPARDILVGGDAGIRIHWGNVPSNYEGCIGVGSKVDGDSIDDTVRIFNQLYGIISCKVGLTIDICDIPA